MADRTRKTPRTRSKAARSEPEALEDLAARARSGDEQAASEALKDEALKDEALKDEALKDEALKDEALEDLAARARSTDEQTASEALKDEALEDLAARARSGDEQAANRSNPEELVEEDRHSLEAVEVNAAIKDGMAALSAEILSFGNKRLNANLEWSQSLVACKDAEQAFRVHTGFFESAVRQYLDQANKVMAIMASMTGSVWAPLEEQTKESLGELNREAVSGQAPETLKPAVPKKRSVTPDYIVCLEDGKKLKMLKRHLRTSYNLSPEEYRKKWGLLDDYPMVAPKYAAQRSKLAKQIGLGKSRRKSGKKAAA